MFSVFRPEFLYVPRAVLGQNIPRTPYFAISRPWGSGRPKRKNVKKLRTLGGKLLGRPGFPPKLAPSTGKLHFSVFGPAPGCLQVPSTKYSGAVKC